jgi:hypothetical protein
MGLVKIIEQITNPETSGVPQLIEVDQLSVASGVVTLSSGVTLTYTSTASTIPSDTSLFESFEGVVNASIGVGSSVVGPTIYDALGGIIYPAI